MSPIYEFECPQCRAREEVIESFEAPFHTCSKCGGNMTRLISAPAMVKIKGQGYPSRRKWVKGTAPFSGGQKEWTPDNPIKFK